MVIPSTALLTATVPMIVATAGIAHITEVAFKRNGKPVGTLHYHYKGKKAIGHRHEGGHLSHYHKGLKGYGRTRKSLRK